MLKILFDKFLEIGKSDSTALSPNSLTTLEEHEGWNWLNAILHRDSLIRYLKNVKWEYHDCTILGDKGYLSASVQQDLFETANITLEVPYRLNQKNRKEPSFAYKRFRKRIETVFSHLNDHLMMIRNYAKQPEGFLARMAAKVAAFTMLQYFNLINQKPIGQVKYALF